MGEIWENFGNDLDVINVSINVDNYLPKHYLLYDYIIIFRKQGKSRSTNILCTLAHLYEETFLQPHQLDFFDSTFRHIPAQFSFQQPSQLPFIYIFRQYNRIIVNNQRPSARSATQPTHPCNISLHHHLPIITHQGKHHAVPRHSTHMYNDR